MKVDKIELSNIMGITIKSLITIEKRKQLNKRLDDLGYTLKHKTKEGRKVYYEIEGTENNINSFISYRFKTNYPKEFIKMIKIRIEDCENSIGVKTNAEISKELNMSNKTICKWNKQLIECGFLVKDGKEKIYYNEPEAKRIEVKKNNINPDIIIKLRSDFNKYISKRERKLECYKCKSNIDLALHHSSKSFSLILSEAIELLNLNYNITDKEYKILSNYMLGVQIKQEYRTLCKNCHDKIHKYYLIDKYKTNKDNELYKIGTGQIKYINFEKEIRINEGK